MPCHGFKIPGVLGQRDGKATVEAFKHAEPERCEATSVDRLNTNRE
jgi:hypothetical protein